MESECCVQLHKRERHCKASIDCAAGEVIAADHATDPPTGLVDQGGAGKPAHNPVVLQAQIRQRWITKGSATGIEVGGFMPAAGIERESTHKQRGLISRFRLLQGKDHRIMSRALIPLGTESQQGQIPWRRPLQKNRRADCHCGGSIWISLEHLNSLQCIVRLPWAMAHHMPAGENQVTRHEETRAPAFGTTRIDELDAASTDQVLAVVISWRAHAGGPIRA